MSKHIYVMRGLPGSGRKGWVERNLKSPTIEHNFQSFLMRLTDYGSRPIVIMGTNVHLHEVSPYVYVSRAWAIPLTVVTCAIDPLKADGENKAELIEMSYELHGAMLPAEWGVEEIVHYEKNDGWFRPVPLSREEKPVHAIEAIRRELRSVSPSIGRLRSLAGM